MPNAPTRLNSSFEGRCVLEGELGEGGVATVFLAPDLKRERRVLEPDLAERVGSN